MTPIQVDDAINEAVENVAYVSNLSSDSSLVLADAESLGGLPAENYATKNYVVDTINQAQLGGDNSEIDLSIYATKDDLTLLSNTIPTTPEDIGAEVDGAAENALNSAKTYVNEQINAIDYPVDSVNGKTGTVTLSASDVGAAASSHNHSASDINSGKLALTYGGTGQNLSNIPKGAVVRNSTDGTGLWYAAAKSGAFYATAEETAPKFGILPIEQGGTGATTPANAVSELGIKDYVVQQGGSGMWTYRLWNSGIAECWGTEALTNFTCSVRANDRLYRSEEFANITFPFNFTSIPVWNVTVTDFMTSAGGGYFGGVIYLYGAFPNCTGKYAVYSEAALSFTAATAQHYAIGRWK